jgi:hypothetical protein
MSTTTDMQAFRETRKFKVASQLVEVGRSLWAFNYGDGQYLSRAVDRAMKEVDAAFLCLSTVAPDSILSGLARLVNGHPGRSLFCKGRAFPASAAQHQSFRQVAHPPKYVDVWGD